MLWTIMIALMINNRSSEVTASSLPTPPSPPSSLPSSSPSSCSTCASSASRWATESAISSSARYPSASRSTADLRNLLVQTS
ncbi:hypothetical protein, conserved [Babesia bigemina]|uniref:Secreted protein n=1 Tax=Babesia bigemina TaxID=5866 RepID=A0A061BRA5_BABBI|nr:hypothetical protein, conserved [Babesia bigemina]CDR71973.1 hypothetical protein, conserved [Babesia bigemina]|eukprot:XP_012770914.1 hypothetical protein, conserved [Babesia bigemina]